MFRKGGQQSGPLYSENPTSAGGKKVGGGGTEDRKVSLASVLAEMKNQDKGNRCEKGKKKKTVKGAMSEDGHSGTISLNKEGGNVLPKLGRGKLPGKQKRTARDKNSSRPIADRGGGSSFTAGRRIWRQGSPTEGRVNRKR